MSSTHPRPHYDLEGAKREVGGSLLSIKPWCTDDDPITQNHLYIKKFLEYYYEKVDNVKLTPGQLMYASFLAGKAHPADFTQIETKLRTD